MKSSNRTGAVLPLVVTLLPVLLLIMAYVIHIAHVETLHSRVQTVTDVAAKSAGRAYARTGDRLAALDAAREAASRNPVGDVVLPFELTDLEFGTSDRTSLNQGYTFSALPDGHQGNPGNAVRLTTHTLRNADPPLLRPIFPTFGIDAPIRPLKAAANTQGALDVVLVLDRSGSMRYAADEVADPYVLPAAEPPGWAVGDPIYSPSRWMDTVAAVDEFVEYLESTPQAEKIGLSTYSTNPSTELKLTFDTSKVAPAMATITNAFYGGGTAIGKGMSEGLASLSDPSVSRRWAVRVMVLMTDGEHNRDVDPEDLVRDLQDGGVTLFTVTFSDEADEGRMQALAEACGGENFSASNAKELRSAFTSISRRLPSLLTE